MTPTPAMNEIEETILREGSLKLGVILLAFVTSEIMLAL
jgi:hypothetical protein